MARLFSGILGVGVATLAFSAAHLDIASGNDLDTFQDRYGASSLVVPGSSPAINREDKADRVAPPTKDATKTVAIKVDQLENTSVLIRISADKAELATKPVNGVQDKMNPRPAQRKLVACEPVVSALTEVAKLLEPGRCMT